MRRFLHILLAVLFTVTLVSANTSSAFASAGDNEHVMEMEVNGYHVTLESQNEWKKGEDIIVVTLMDSMGMPVENADVEIMIASTADDHSASENTHAAEEQHDSMPGMDMGDDTSHDSMLEVWSFMLNWLEKTVGTTNYAVTFSITFATAIIIPVALLGLTSWLAGKFNRSTFVENFARFGYAIIALNVAGHIAHNLFHLLAEGKSIFYTAMVLFGQEFHGASPALVSMETIQLLQYGLIALGLIGSLYTAYNIAKKNHAQEKVCGTFVPYVALIVILTVMNVYLFMLPMAMRM
jgi:hypothetical protein